MVGLVTDAGATRARPTPYLAPPTHPYRCAPPQPRMTLMRDRDPHACAHSRPRLPLSPVPAALSHACRSLPRPLPRPRQHTPAPALYLDRARPSHRPRLCMCTPTLVLAPACTVRLRPLSLSPAPHARARSCPQCRQCSCAPDPVSCPLAPTRTHAFTSMRPPSRPRCAPAPTLASEAGAARAHPTLIGLVGTRAGPFALGRALAFGPGFDPAPTAACTRAGAIDSPPQPASPMLSALWC
ncbi:hypothetical protein FRC06_004044, partial [Ceratobasidium sp. 370]